MLKLAELHERAYEEFVLELAERDIEDIRVRAEVRKLVSASDGHGARIQALLAALRERSAQATRAEIERVALLNILDVERAARDFYVKHVDDVLDPRAAELFRDLAREEARHVDIALGALALADRRHGKIQLRPDAQKAIRMLDDGPTGA